MVLEGERTGGALESFPIYPAGVLPELRKVTFRNSGSLS